MPIPNEPVEIERPLPEETIPLAADGFPIDQSLQRRARRAAASYGLLALYYICMTPFVLKFVRWGTLHHIAEDLLNRTHILVPFVGYIAANIVLAVCAWHVCSRTRLGSWATVVLAGAATLAACGPLALNFWRALLAIGSPRLPWSTMALSAGLIAAYLVSFVLLFRPVLEFNRQRRLALDQLEGRISP